MTGRKRGVSIGAAMKQRMGDQELSSVQEEVQPEAVPVSAPPLTKRATAPIPAPTKVSPEDDPLESFNTRLPRSLQRRLKVHVALNDLKIQDVLCTALDEYLKKAGN